MAGHCWMTVAAIFWDGEVSGALWAVAVAVSPMVTVKDRVAARSFTSCTVRFLLELSCRPAYCLRTLPVVRSSLRVVAFFGIYIFRFRSCGQNPPNKRVMRHRFL